MLVEIKGHIHCSVPGNQEVRCYNHQVLASDSQHEAEELYLKNNNDILEYRIYHIFNLKKKSSLEYISHNSDFKNVAYKSDENQKQIYIVVWTPEIH